ncbi:MAG TPA: DUF4142 domain-containing protein [Stenotrophomonas sp.]|nr:DUF4142 domain-containing protein [Stenotrophomonas sp.]
MITRTSRCATLLALAVAAATAHAQTQTPTRTPDPATRSATPATPATPAGPATQKATSGTLTQPQALGVLSAINQAEIGAGELAQKKVTSGPVHDYAERMVKEHTDNERKLDAWSPDRNAPPAKAQMAKGKQEQAKLSGLKDDAFRTAYINAMVKDHTEALNALDKKLIPAAKDAEVRAFLQETRTHVAAHLASAKQLQSGGAAKDDMSHKDATHKDGAADTH